MLELLSYRFFINALLAALLASISCGIIGSYIVARRMVFIGGGITHASLGGIGLGIYLGVNPLLSAALFAMLTAISIEVISKKTEIREDSIIGMMWSLGMAVGIIFVYLGTGYLKLESYLFGDILAVSAFDLYLMLAVSALVIVIFIALFKEILYISFDEEYARTQGTPTGIINCLLICLVALTVVINIKVVGIILVMSMFTIPQAIAGLFFKDFKTIMLCSIGFCFVTSISGLIASHYLEVPPGACIILVAVLVFIIADIGKRIYIRIVSVST